MRGRCRYLDLVGEKFGSLTVTGIHRTEGAKHTHIVCKCECGREVMRLRWNLSDKATCGECSNRRYTGLPQPWMPPHEYDRLILERMKRTTIQTESGCWEWQGFRHKPPRHYGSTSYRGKNVRAHRLMYKLIKGQIPAGMVVMHSCDNPPCINPDHLKLGTHLENMAECRAKGRYYYANLTHCKRGHEFNDENTYYIKTPGKWFGLRACKACQKLLQRERYQANKEKYRARNREYRRRKRMRLSVHSGATVRDEHADRT